MSKIKNGLNRLFCILQEKHDERRDFRLRSEFLKFATLHTKEQGVSDAQLCDKEVIVSLTTYSKRYYEVYLTIESIMQGTVKPNRIILWLADEMKDQYIPVSLQRQMERGLEIGYTKDIRSFKKLIPTLKKYPESIIITIDDDVLYEYDMIENLINAYNADTCHVHGGRLRSFNLDKHGMPEDYRKWKEVRSVGVASPRNMCIGVGGVLYPPHCFTDEVFNEAAFMDLCPHADDIWFWCMANMNGYSADKIFTHSQRGIDFLTNPNVQDIALLRRNLTGKSENNSQLHHVINHYQCQFFR